MAAKLKIKDFELFCSTVADIARVSEAAKIDFGPSGFTSSVALAKREKVGRVDFKSDAVCTDDGSEISMATKTLGMFAQLLRRIEKAHSVKGKGASPDYSDVVIALNDTAVGIRSSTLKTKLNLCEACVVNTPAPFTHVCHPLAELSVSISDLKDIIANTFMFSNQDSLSIEVCHQNDMVKNNAYAVLSDPTDPRTNAIATKFGNIVVGDLERKFYFDMPRMQLLAMFDVPKLDLVLNTEPCAITTFTIPGKSGGSSEYRIIFKYLAAPVVPTQMVA